MAALGANEQGRGFGINRLATAAVSLALVLLFGSVCVSALNYVDDFTTRPPALTSASAAFTTGTSAIGLSYSGSPAQLFAWSGTGERNSRIPDYVFYLYTQHWEVLSTMVCER